MFFSTISRRELGGAAALAVLVALLAWPWRAPPPSVEIGGETMGTSYSVVVAGAAAADRARIRAVVEAELDAVVGSMSTWDADSELSRFNRHHSTAPFAASPALLEVFRTAREIAELTGGAFDVTVAPLVAAWGFGATDRAPLPPSAEDLGAARRDVDFRLVAADMTAGTLAKLRPNVTCDLSAIAKGYAVDRAVEALAVAGFGDVLVEIGGDLRAAGRRPDGSPWRVAIEQPVARRGTVQRRLALTDRALATSGDYRSYYESEGRRLSHLIDPRSGAPIANAVASVSVVHESAAVADALATAGSVLGPTAGIDLAERHGWAISFLIRGEGGFAEVQSRSFAELVRSLEDAPAGD